MDWMKYRKVYFLVSALMISISLFSLLKWGINVGLDFRGGALLEYRLTSDISTEDASGRISDVEIEVNSIQKTSDGTYFIKLGPISPAEKEKVTNILSEMIEGEVEELRFETVGPTIGPELVKKTMYAIIIAAIAILLWVAYQFKSIKYGVSAILAMFHDSFILIGALSLLGHFFDAEVDFLFVTALLTTLSFSVHDTIVVFDRIRENQSKHGGDIYHLANQAITETMVRSLNNSFTIMFMLVALILMGGTTIKWFSVALLIGTILGTYSSPFVAVPMLVTWDEVVEKLKSKKESINFQRKSK